MKIDREAFLAALRRLGVPTQGATDWLDEAEAIGLDEDDTVQSLAELCRDDWTENSRDEEEGR